MAKRTLICVLVLLLFMSSSTFAAPEKIRIAVMPFKLGQTRVWWGWNWDPAKGITDMVITDLVNTGKFSVYERERLEDILKELRFGQTGLVDISTAVSIGKLLGVQLLLMGTITRFDLEENTVRIPFVGKIGETTATVQLDLRLVNIETGEIISAFRGEGKDKAHNLSLGSLFGIFSNFSFGSSDFRTTIIGKATTKAVGQVVREIVAKTQNLEFFSRGTITGQIADVAGKEVTLNIGAQHNVQVGDLFQVRRKVREIKDPATGAVIRVVTEVIGEVKITEVLPVASVGVITKTERGQKFQFGDLVELIQ